MEKDKKGKVRIVPIFKNETFQNARTFFLRMHPAKHRHSHSQSEFSMLDCTEKASSHESVYTEEFDEYEITSRRMSSARVDLVMTPLFQRAKFNAEPKVHPMTLALSLENLNLNLNLNLRDIQDEFDEVAESDPVETETKQTQALMNQSSITPKAEPKSNTGSANRNFHNIVVSRSKKDTDKQEAEAISYWRHNSEPILIHQVDQQLADGDNRDFQRNAARRWYDADQKGKHLTQYKRQIMEKNDLIQSVVFLDRLELLNRHEDRWPCLKFRKKARRFAIHLNLISLNIIQRKSFEAATIVVIICNCITLTMNQADQEPNELVLMIENIFQALYTVEMILKILGLGFIFNKGAYLRDYSNILDFFIVISAYISMIDTNKPADGISLASLRVFRVLKPLRAVNNIPGLRLILQAILSALPLLKDTIIVLLFFFLIFAIGGVNIFSGMLRQRCINIETGAVLLDDQGDEVICGAVDICQEDYFCGKRTLNPNYDVTSFDNIFWAMLVIFQCVTLEGWSDLMVQYQRVYSYYAFLYFVPLVFIGAFFLLNLTLAVINTSFNDAQERIKEKKAKAEAELQNLFSQKLNMDEFEEKKIDDQHEDENPSHEPNFLKTIGVLKFFTAKRAARRMRAFATNYHGERKKSEMHQILSKQKEESILQNNDVMVQKLQSCEIIEKCKESNFQLPGQDKESIYPHNTQPSAQSNKSKASSKELSAQKTAEFGRIKSDLGKFVRPTPINTKLRAQNLNSIQSPGLDKNIKPIISPGLAPSTRLQKSPGIPSTIALNKLEPRQTIIEEEQSNPTNRSVQEFLRGLDQVNHDEEQKLVSSSIKNSPQFKQLLSDNQQTQKSDQQRASTPIMAFNDLRRANANNPSQADKAALAIKNEDNSSNNFDVQMEKGKILKKHLQEELDFDQMMTAQVRLGSIDQQLEQSMNKDTTNPIKPSSRTKNRLLDNKVDICGDTFSFDNHSYQDLHDTIHPESKNSIVTSVISSHSSIYVERKKSAVEKDSIGQTKIKEPNTEGPIDGWIPSRDMNRNIKGMLTVTDFNTRRGSLDLQGDQINDDVTTFYGGQSVKQQIDLFSNLNEPTNFGNFASMMKKEQTIPKEEKGHLSIKGSKNAQAKKKISQMYQSLNVKEFVINENNNPYNIFNFSKQKIHITPAVPYRSTSQNDVFERRNKLKFNQRLKSLNRFIIFSGKGQQHKDQAEKDTFREKFFLSAKFEPWQFKHKLRIQQVDEVKFDDDDEDALVLYQQPFETLISINQSDMLSHLPTKLLARRSDIIVSSTISITLTPYDNFKHQSFALLDADGIQNWVKHRNVFRALGVSQATLLDRNRLNDREATQTSKCFSDEDSDEARNQVNTIMKRTWTKFQFLDSALKGSDEQINYKQLPRTLLSSPLNPEQAALLSEHDRRKYNIQKAKWETELRQSSKQAVRPQDRIFDEQDVEKMIAGDYYSDSEDEQKNETVETVLLGRTGLDQQLRLDQFDDALHEIVSGSHENKRIDARLKHVLARGHIPDWIRNDLNLPQDMRNRDVDFKEVRIMDSLSAIKYPEWSGQEVLATSINCEQASSVTNQISSIRVWPKDYMNTIKKVRSVLKLHCLSPIFEHFMTLCVFVNTIVMSMDRYGIKPDLEQVLSIINQAFTYIFIYEMTVKLMALGLKKYTASKWNLLDGGVVLLSILEIIVEQQSQSTKSGSSLSAFRTVKVFRTFRVMRVARILRALHSMQVIIGVISRSFKSFMYVILLMMLFVFIYALLGIQIYQGQYDFGPDESLPSAHFEEFGIAFVTVFQVLTMEQWQEVMYMSMRSARGSTFLKSLTAVYYVSWIFIGNFILLNLFLAILIDSFTNEENESQVNEQVHLDAEKRAAEISLERQEELRNMRLKRLGGNIKHNSSKRQKQIRDMMKRQKARVTFTGNTAIKETFELVEDLDELDPVSIHSMLVNTKIIRDKSQKRQDWIIPEQIECKNSIYIFNRSGIFRRACYYIQQHRYFDRFIMLLIVVSSLQLAFETYIQDMAEDDRITIINVYIGKIFTYLFMFEFLFKLVALGFVMDDGSYLRESWNQLDFFIVMTSLVDNIMSSSDIAALKILRMLRILRPLRVVSHNLQLKMIVIALLDAGGSILNVIVVILVVWLMFAIFAVNTYKGHFFYCSIDKYVFQDRYDCIKNGGEWLLYDSNFDNVIQAMMTLFIVSSLEGWPEIMNQAMDITKENRGPKYQNNIKQAIFFIVFILIGSFFFLNFFIGVLFLKYSEAQKRETAGFTEQQLFWSEMQAMILQAKVPINATHKPRKTEIWRLKAYYVATSYVFEVSIIAVIILNMLQMAIMYEGSGTTVQSFIELTNYIFTTIFIIEAALKIFVFGWAYFKTSWNKFDFFVVISSILDIILLIYQSQAMANGQDEVRSSQQSALSTAPQLARVLRVLRVSRVLRIANHYKGLQQLFNTIMLSVSGLVNVFMLLMLFFFILAILGQFMFNGVTEGVIINEYKNFTVFDRSFLLLFSISTGEDWNLIMYDCSRTLPDCEPGVTCGSDLAPAYFIAVILLVTYVMLNLFILVIVQQFEKLYLDTDGPLQQFDRDYSTIVKQWIKFTSQTACLKLQASKVQKFLQQIAPLLGKSDLSEPALKKQVLKMGIKSEDGFIYFNELLYRILRNRYGNFQLNKKMQIRELITQFKLFNMTLSSVKMKKQNDPLKKFFRKVGSGGKDTVNPFLTNMYCRMSFQAWFRVMKQKQKEDIKKIDPIQQLGLGELKLKNEEKQAKSSIFKYEEAIEVDIEQYSVQTVSSDAGVELESERSNDKIDQEGALGDQSRQLTNVSPRGIRNVSRVRMQSAKYKLLTQENEIYKLPYSRAKSQLYVYLSTDSNPMLRRLTNKKVSKEVLLKETIQPLGSVKGISQHSQEEEVKQKE